MKILLVEDDLSLSATLKDFLERKSFVVESCVDGDEALYWLTNFDFAMAVLDWEIPRLSGIDVLRKYREAGGKIPILILTARTSTSDKVEGLESGADDYLAKPFEPSELLARIRALMRRSSDYHEDTLVVGELELNTSSQEVKFAGNPVILGRKEFAILELLMRNPGRIFSSAALIERLWGNEEEVTEISVRSHIARLRAKLQEAGDGKISPLKNVYGLGYKLEQG